MSTTGGTSGAGGAGAGAGVDHFSEVSGINQRMQDLGANITALCAEISAVSDQLSAVMDTMKGDKLAPLGDDPSDDQKEAYNKAKSAWKDRRAGYQKQIAKCCGQINDLQGDIANAQADIRKEEGKLGGANQRAQESMSNELDTAKKDLEAAAEAAVTDDVDSGDEGKQIIKKVEKAIVDKNGAVTTGYAMMVVNTQAANTTGQQQAAKQGEVPTPTASGIPPAGEPGTT